MAKRGPKPAGKVKLEWSPEFAYAIGLITADGCLSKDGRHIDFTSKDIELIQLFQKSLGIEVHIGRKARGSLKKKVYFVTQFSDVLFYRFLESIGLTPAKSKTISSVAVPKKYFLDFLRGYFDGDGCSYSYYDPVYEKSYRFYISFASASPKYFDWLRENLREMLGVKGFISYNRNKPPYLQLKYSKKEAVLISKAMYYSENIPRLQRKHLKITKSLEIIREIENT